MTLGKSGEEDLEGHKVTKGRQDGWRACSRSSEADTNAKAREKACVGGPHEQAGDSRDDDRAVGRAELDREA